MTDSTPPIELTIRTLGGLGDGIANYNGKTVFVPFTCAGDIITARIRQEKKDIIQASLISVLTPSPQRQSPACRHFGLCGGCSLQHVTESTYYDFKHAILSRIAMELGTDPSLVTPVIRVGKGSRRRIDLKIAIHDGNVRIGFYAPRSHQLIDLSECPISDDTLITLLPPLKACIASLQDASHIQSIRLTACEQGCDAIVTTQNRLSDADQQLFIAFAQTNGLVRLSEQSGEKLYSLFDTGNAHISFAGICIALPTGAFLQATQAGQLAITECVTRYLSGCQSIADLYSGCGTYTFPLREHADHISAFEGSAEMVTAMHNAIHHHGLADRLTATMRDLFHEPLLPQELNAYDGIVINPPHNGALPQIKHIAASGVKKLVMVSCNPASFKRDARCLIDVGFRLTELVPIDQFYWSSHLELVACFSRI